MVRLIPVSILPTFFGGIETAVYSRQGVLVGFHSRQKFWWTVLSVVL